MAPGAPPGLGGAAAFVCAGSRRSDAALFSKTQLAKGAARRCKACIAQAASDRQAALQAKQQALRAESPRAAAGPVPMDEDTDSEMEGYA